MDYEHQELENKIRDLERQIQNMEYDIRRLQDDKADIDHSHKQYQVKEDY